MHDSKLVLKSGEVQICPLYKWRPEEGWVQLFDNDPVRLSEVESGYLGGVSRKRMPKGSVEPVSVDVLVRAREEGWNGE